MKKIIDNIGTACWLGMDICWMKQYNTAAVVFMFLAILLLTIPAPKKKDTEILGWLATVCWLYMNSAWMSNDILLANKIITPAFDLFDYVSNIFMIAGSVTVILILIFDTHRIIKIRRFK